MEKGVRSVEELSAIITHLNQRMTALEASQVDLLSEIQALRENTETYQILLDESSDPIFAFQRDGSYRYVNRAFADGVQRSIEQIIGHKIWDVFSQDEADKRFAVVEWVFKNSQTRDIEVRVPRTDGDRFYLTTAKPVNDEQGAVTMVICISKEITERKRMEEELRRLSISDMLTGLYNRYFFETEANRYQESRLFPVTIVMIDVDNLKRVNDTMGHAAGDEVIRKAAEVLKLSFRAEDIIARFGGDEFVVMLPKTDAAAAADAVERLRNNIEKCGGQELSLSIGYATGEKNTSLSELMRLADDRMYQDKANRKE